MPSVFSESIQNFRNLRISSDFPLFSISMRGHGVKIRGKREKSKTAKSGRTSEKILPKWPQGFGLGPAQFHRKKII
jgi:hypothetical protein